MSRKALQSLRAFASSKDLSSDFQISYEVEQIGGAGLRREEGAHELRKTKLLRLLKITDALPPKALQSQGPVQSLKDVLRL